MSSRGSLRRILLLSMPIFALHLFAARGPPPAESAARPASGSSPKSAVRGDLHGAKPNASSSMDALAGNGRPPFRPPPTPGPVVLLTLSASRTDRMGSRVAFPLGAWLLARRRGWLFCSPEEAMTSALSFPICSAEYPSLAGAPRRRFYGSHNVNGTGVYEIWSGGAPIWREISASEDAGGDETAYTEGAIGEWRRMILGARLRPGLEGELWLRPGSFRIAAHVRRGDIEPNKRNDVWIHDDVAIMVIEMCASRIRRARGEDADVEVHLFSESYGVTNWTRYEGLVDGFHLAPEGSTDVQLNLRDWKHFVAADALVTGHTFSWMPGLARPRMGGDGLPVTMFWGKRGGEGYKRRDWVPWKRRYLGGRAGGGMEVVADFEDGRVTARVGHGVGAHEGAEGGVDKEGRVLPIDSIIGARYVIETVTEP